MAGEASDTAGFQIPVQDEALGHSGRSLCYKVACLCHSSHTMHMLYTAQCQHLVTHTGFQAAGAFTKQKRHLQTGAAAGQMLAIDRQMHELLSKMQHHNALIGARHLQDVKDVHSMQHAAASGDFGGISFSSELQSKLDISLAQVQSNEATALC